MTKIEDKINELQKQLDDLLLLPVNLRNIIKKNKILEMLKILKGG